MVTQTEKHVTHYIPLRNHYWLPLQWVTDPDDRIKVESQRFEPSYSQTNTYNYAQEHRILRTSMTPLTLGLLRSKETKFHRFLQGGGIVILNQLTVGFVEHILKCCTTQRLCLKSLLHKPQQNCL